MSIHRTDPPRQLPTISALYHLAGSSRSCDVCGNHYNPSHIYSLRVTTYPTLRYACANCVITNKLELGKKSLQRFNSIKKEAS